MKMCSMLNPLKSTMEGLENGDSNNNSSARPADPTTKARRLIIAPIVLIVLLILVTCTRQNYHALQTETSFGAEQWADLYESIHLLRQQRSQRLKGLMMDPSLLDSSAGFEDGFEDGPINISLDKERLEHPFERVVLSWDEQLQDSDVLVLVCQMTQPRSTHSLQATMFMPVDILSVAHIADGIQEQPTTGHSFQWTVDSFSQTKSNFCQYHLYRLKETESTSTMQSVLSTWFSSFFNIPSVQKTFPPFVRIGQSPIIDLRRAVAQSPTQIHLSLGSEIGQIFVSFTTGVTSSSASSQASGTPVAVYGTDPTSMNNKITSSDDTWTTTYSASDMCGAPANKTSSSSSSSTPFGYFHTVRISGLKPSVIYYYKVGLATGQGVIWSDTINHFTSPPPPRVVTENAKSSTSDNLNDYADVDASESFSYIVFGDHGTPTVWGDDATQWVMNQILSMELLQGDCLSSEATTSSLALQRRRHRHHGHTPPQPNQNSNGTNLPIAMVHHIGDISYARGNSPVWDEWFSMIEPVASTVPYMVTIGNHEYDHTSGGGNGKDPSGVPTDSGFMPKWGNFGDDSGGECGVPTSKRFTMPSTISPNRQLQSNGVFWYSYDFGMLHTIGLSSEHDVSHGSPMYEWLAEDLALVNRTTTPWVVVEIHRPLYESQIGWTDTAVSIAMRLELESILNHYQVDLVISGHYHSYMRTCDGLFRSKCPDPAKKNDSYMGPTYITVGTAGAQLTKSPHYPNSWTVKHVEATFGYGRVTIANATVLHFEFIKVGSPDDDTSGSVLDDAWIHRPNHS